MPSNEPLRSDSPPNPQAAPCGGPVRGGPDYDSLTEEVEEMRGRLVALRRHFHTFPELSGEEKRTAAFVAAHLNALGLTVREGIGGHGVLARLAGAHPGPTVGYRAELDALPIQDVSDKPYASLKLGVKHACGHDAHMAIALGIAELLARRRDQLHGDLIFIFQPAEESLDGAAAMLQSGALSADELNCLLAWHAFPMTVGSVGVNAGPCLAGMEEFRVRFYAPGGDLNGLVVRASAALEALSSGSVPQSAAEIQELIVRMERGGSLEKTVFLSCWSHPEGSVPPWHLLGLVSMPDFDLRTIVRAQIRETLDRVVADVGASYDVVHTFSNPPLRNHGPLVREITSVLEGILGAQSVKEFRDPYPFAHEDFALYAKQVPSALLWLGTASADGEIPSLLHTADYDVDEEALIVGTRAMTAVLLHLLRQEEGPGPPERQGEGSAPERPGHVDRAAPREG